MKRFCAMCDKEKKANENVGPLCDKCLGHAEELMNPDTLTGMSSDAYEASDKYRGGF
jgi:hypothetical protein|tara:strand:+ start:1846 stop:2016 length:171 start_codon:yes stop_codon:yes gene_type:complete